MFLSGEWIFYMNVSNVFVKSESGDVVKGVPQ